MSNIMVVDDDPDVRRILQKRLTASGFKVAAYDQARTALSSLRQFLPDLVILDVNMPGMDGIEACRRIKESYPQLPVLFLTARGDVEDRLIGFEAGGRDYILKPFEPEELLARIRATLAEKTAKESAEKKAESLESLSSTDPLTGVSNERHFAERLEAEQARTRRYGSRLACLRAEIDYFAQNLETFGRPGVDQALIAAAQAFREELRASDLVSRQGEAGFALLLPETDLAEASALAERLRRKIEALPPLATRPAVTVSFGVSAGGDAELVKRADAALAEARENGGNQVVEKTAA